MKILVCGDTRVLVLDSCIQQKQFRKIHWMWIWKTPDLYFEVYVHVLSSVGNLENKVWVLMFQLWSLLWQMCKLSKQLL